MASSSDEQARADAVRCLELIQSGKIGNRAVEMLNRFSDPRQLHQLIALFNNPNSLTAASELLSAAIDSPDQVGAFLEILESEHPSDKQVGNQILSALNKSDMRERERGRIVLESTSDSEYRMILWHLMSDKATEPGTIALLDMFGVDRNERRTASLLLERCANPDTRKELEVMIAKLSDGSFRAQVVQIAKCLPDQSNEKLLAMLVSENPEMQNTARTLVSWLPSGKGAIDNYLALTNASQFDTAGLALQLDRVPPDSRPALALIDSMLSSKGTADDARTILSTLPMDEIKLLPKIRMKEIKGTIVPMLGSRDELDRTAAVRLVSMMQVFPRAFILRTRPGEPTRESR